MSGAGALPGSQIAAGGLTNSSVLNRYSEGIAVSPLLTDFGRTANQVASAHLRAQAAEEDVELAREEVLLRVHRAYFDVLRRQALFQVARETVQERQLVADQVGALARSKLNSAVDVSFANVNLAQARLLLVQVEGDLQASFATLSEVLGYADRHVFEPAEAPLPEAPPDDVAALIEEALSKRPDMARERLNKDAARRTG